MIRARHAALAAGSLLVVGSIALAALLPVSTAGAEPIGSIAVSPVSGTTTSALTLTTSGPCTNAAATALQARIIGNGFPATGQQISAVAALDGLGSTASGGYVLPISDTLRDYGNVPSPVVTFSGDYALIIKCRTNTGVASLGDFTGSLHFTSPTNYTAGNVSASPTANPSATPSATPSGSPTATPTASPSGTPTASPSGRPTASASARPTSSPSVSPSAASIPTLLPSSVPLPIIAPGTTASLLALDAAGAPLQPNPVLTRLQHITITATGYAAGEHIVARMASSPLGTATATPDGVVSYPFSVPAGLAPGGHTLQLAGSTRVSLFAFRIAADTTLVPISAGGARSASGSSSALPFTGADVVPATLLGLFLIWIGAMIVMYAGGPVSAGGRHARRSAQPRHLRPRG
jgi:hypothetical protein